MRKKIFYLILIFSHLQYGCDRSQKRQSILGTTASSVGEIRSFKSFKEAADENASSRIMVGIHFRFACDAGQKDGR